MGKDAILSLRSFGDVIQPKGVVFLPLKAHLPGAAVSRQSACRGDRMRSPDPGRALACGPVHSHAVLPPEAPLHRTRGPLAAEQPHG